MKRISSKFTLTLLVTLATGAFALAEDAKPAGGAAGARPGGRRAEGGAGRLDPDARAKKMQTDLGLSDDQTAKVKGVFEKNQAANGEAMKKLREDTTLSQEDKRKKFGELFASTAEEVKAILTPEQQTKWKEEMEKRRTEGGGRRGAKPDGAKPGGAKPEAKTDGAK